MSAVRAVTPRVVTHLRDSLADIPRNRRASFCAAQLVLRELARWARAVPDQPGRWTVTDTIKQLVTATCLTDAQVRRALDCLARVGLLETLRHGGGTGVAARGSLRMLILDPVDNLGTTRAERAEFHPELRALAPGTTRASDVNYARSGARLRIDHPLRSSARAPRLVPLPRPELVATGLYSSDHWETG